MCGICAYIGYCESYGYIIHGLKMLQNRGYDSAGICSISYNHNFKCMKYASDSNEKALSKIVNKDVYFNNSNIGIGHTRWSTHGGKTDNNAHPHISHNNKFALVHNGIIENYMEIKKELISKGIKFQSDTDSEVIVNLISYNYGIIGDVETAITDSINRLSGTWGLVILCTDTPHKLYAIRHGSPLLIGFGDDYAIISSEQSGFGKFVDSYKCVDNNDLVVIEKSNNKISYNFNHNIDLYKVSASLDITTPDPYPHWTLKEINEQVNSIRRAMGFGGRINNMEKVKLGGLSQYKFELSEIDNLIILGCGTSFYAGSVGSYVLKEISGFNTVQVIDGGEFSLYDIPNNGKTGVIVISQSGETRDLLNCIDLIKSNTNDIFIIGIINVVDSMIAREANCGVYLNAGKEVGVASTKVFTSQVIVLYLIAIWFAQIKSIDNVRRLDLISNLTKLPENAQLIINSIDNQIESIATHIKDHKNLFTLGKGISFAIAREGALKIKELSYIHAEGYSSSALKHGPYSLIDNGTCVIIINPNDQFYHKNISVIEELKARNAFVVSITDIETETNKADVIIEIPENGELFCILAVIPLQLLAYKLAVMKNLDVDMPRNLAKSVTTD